MKINKTFAPISILIETEEDLSFIRETIMKAYQHDGAGRFFNLPGSYGSRSRFQEKLDYLQGLLK